MPLAEIQRRVRKHESFAFETTLSGHSYARMIPEWRGDGYRVRLIFLSLPDVGMAISRVKMRVAQGGHNVSSAVIRRRFESGLRNFREIYIHLVDKWEWYDNSGTAPQLLSEAGSWRERWAAEYVQFHRKRKIRCVRYAELENVP